MIVLFFGVNCLLSRRGGASPVRWEQGRTRTARGRQCLSIFDYSSTDSNHQCAET